MTTHTKPGKTKYGGNDVVEVKDLPKPNPLHGEMLIKVRAASINPVDWKIRSGMIRGAVGEIFPLPLGRECSGEVVEVGPKVKKFNKGDPVVAVPDFGKLGFRTGVFLFVSSHPQWL